MGKSNQAPAATAATAARTAKAPKPATASPAARAAKTASTGAAAKAAKAGVADIVREAVRRHEGKPGALLAVLEETQRLDERRHLSEEALRAISATMGEPLSRVYSVATFYSYFSLVPQGKHVIVVCRGTACHTRGSLGLLQEALARLGAKDYREDEEASFTTDDAQFTVRTVACFGQCALAPVVSIDGTIYSRITTNKLCSVIDAIKKGRAK